MNRESSLVMVMVFLLGFIALGTAINLLVGCGVIPRPAEPSGADGLYSSPGSARPGMIDGYQKCAWVYVDADGVKHAYITTCYRA
jgi:hypothetical protein